MWAIQLTLEWPRWSPSLSIWCRAWSRVTSSWITWLSPMGWVASSWVPTSCRWVSRVMGWVACTRRVSSRISTRWWILAWWILAWRVLARRVSAPSRVCPTSWGIVTSRWICSASCWVTTMLAMFASRRVPRRATMPWL